MSLLFCHHTLSVREQLDMGQILSILVPNGREDKDHKTSTTSRNLPFTHSYQFPQEQLLCLIAVLKMLVLKCLGIGKYFLVFL